MDKFEMTQDEIIRMAREAGFDPDYFDNIECSCNECNFLKEPLERFAALVAAHEREACAKVCEEYADAAFYQFEERGDRFDDGESNGATGCAAAIRERSAHARARGEK